MGRPISHTNRKGQTFYLHLRRGSQGRPCYVFAREPAEGTLSSIPPDHEIVEGVHGTVSLRKIQPRPITDLELRAVQRALEKHQHLRLCRAAIKGKTIEVYEARHGLSSLGDDHPFGWGAGWSTARLREHVEKTASYWATMRFVLVDARKREFRVERMCYRSWHDSWLSLEKTGPLSKLAEKYLPHLGRESFFELWP